MSRHFDELSQLRNRISAQDFNPKEKDQTLCMQIIMHSADISNGVRQFDIAFNWAERIMQEFWDQVFIQLFKLKFYRETKKNNVDCL